MNRVENCLLGFAGACVLIATANVGIGLARADMGQHGTAGDHDLVVYAADLDLALTPAQALNLERDICSWRDEGASEPSLVPHVQHELGVPMSYQQYEGWATRVIRATEFHFCPDKDPEFRAAGPTPGSVNIPPGQMTSPPPPLPPGASGWMENQDGSYTAVTWNGTPVGAGK